MEESSKSELKRRNYGLLKFVGRLIEKKGKGENIPGIFLGKSVFREKGKDTIHAGRPVGRGLSYRATPRPRRPVCPEVGITALGDDVRRPGHMSY